MGYKATEAVLLMDVGSVARKCVLLALAARADNETFECYPSLSRLAMECNTSRRTVITHLAALVELGAIEKRARYNDKGQTSNGYKIISGQVVKELHHPSEGASPPSEGASLGVVKELHPNQSCESVNKSVNASVKTLIPLAGAIGGPSGGEPLSDVKPWAKYARQAFPLNRWDKLDRVTAILDYYEPMALGGEGVEQLAYQMITKREKDGGEYWAYGDFAESLGRYIQGANRQAGNA